MNSEELLDQLEQNLLTLVQLEQEFDTAELNLEREKALVSISGTVDELLEKCGVKRTGQAIIDALTIIFHERYIELGKLKRRVDEAKIAVELSRLRVRFALENESAKQKDKEFFDEF